MHTILIVDDSDAHRRLLRAVLSNAGYATREAADGAEALAALSVQPMPDLIILDLRMPGMDGFEFRAAQRARAEYAAIPTLICTCEPDPATLAAKLGAAGHLEKSSGPRDILATVALYLPT